MDVFSSCYEGSTTLSNPDVIRLTLRGDIEGLERCLDDAGCSPDTIDAHHRRTGLHHAASRGLDGAMATLLSAGADPNFRDIHGNTPLHLCGHAMTLMLLINYGADPRLRNTTGVTALEMMRRRGVADDIVAKLAEYEKGYDEEKVFGVGDPYEILMDAENEVVEIRQRRTAPVPPFISLDRREEDEDSDFIEHSLHDRLISPDPTPSPSPTSGDAPSNVFTIMSGGCRRRRRGFRPAFESRPLSVFHEFFLSMDPKTLGLFVFSIFCLALFAAFYVTGVHMNYFGSSEEAKDVGVDSFHVDENLVKMVPVGKES